MRKTIQSDGDMATTGRRRRSSVYLTKKIKLMRAWESLHMTSSYLYPWSFCLLRILCWRRGLWYPFAHIFQLEFISNKRQWRDCWPIDCLANKKSATREATLLCFLSIKNAKLQRKLNYIFQDAIFSCCSPSGHTFSTPTLCMSVCLNVGNNV